MNFMTALELAASGLHTSRVRLNVTAGNIANAQTTRTPEAAVRADTRPPRTVYDPGHPDADARGIVKLPNINLVEEMVDMVASSRAFEAGVTTIQTVKAMADKALSIGR